MSSDSKLPPGWDIVHLRDCGDWHGGGTPSKAMQNYWRDGTIPWISPKDMKVFRIAASEDRITNAAVQETNVSAFPPGTVLMVIRSGILSRTFPVAVATVTATMNQDLKGVTPFEFMTSEYLAYFLVANERRILMNCSKHGTTVASIDTGSLHHVSVKRPPIN